MRPSALHAFGAIVRAGALLAASACAAPDPYAAALRERQALQVEILSWSPGGGRIRFEAEVRGSAPRLEFLTVLVTQHDERGDPVREDRVPLPLDGIGTTGVKQVLGSVPAAAGEPDSLSIQVEAIPPDGTEPEFPELRSIPAEG